MGSSAHVCSAGPSLLEGFFVGEKPQSHAGAWGPLFPLTAVEMDSVSPHTEGSLCWEGPCLILQHW